MVTPVSSATGKNPPKKRPLKPKAQPPAYTPASWEAADAKALQMLYEGTATAHQQKRALSWIITMAAASNEPPFRPGGQDGDRETAFACGRAFVGQQIVGLLKINLIGIETESSTRGV